MLALPVRVWPAYVPRVASASFVVEPDGTAVLDPDVVADAARGSGEAGGTGGLDAPAATGGLAAARRFINSSNSTIPALRPASRVTNGLRRVSSGADMSVIPSWASHLCECRP